MGTPKLQVIDTALDKLTVFDSKILLLKTSHI